MIFQYLSYKEFINNFVETAPNRGRGLYKKIADHLGVSTVIISQTFKGERALNHENAFKLTTLLKLSELETKYFLKLVHYEKAGNHELKNFLLEELKELQKESKKVKSTYTSFEELKDEDKFKFYSDKFYSAIRMASSLPDLNSIKDFAEYFNLPESRVEEIVEFLLKTKLCIKKEENIAMGPQHTFVPASSPFIKNHHKNWRIHSINKIDNIDLEDELMYTAPMSLSKDIYQQLRKNLLKTIEETLKLVTPSPEEMVACLSIDLLKLK